MWRRSRSIGAITPGKSDFPETHAQRSLVEGLRAYVRSPMQEGRRGGEGKRSRTEMAILLCGAGFAVLAVGKLDRRYGRWRGHRLIPLSRDNRRRG